MAAEGMYNLDLCPRLSQSDLSLPTEASFENTAVSNLGACDYLTRPAEIKEEPPKLTLAELERHPLFPLLEDLIKKCELATVSAPDSSELSLSSKVLNEKLESSCNQSLASSFETEEVDNLILQAIQVFRFQLLELEKVHQLCDNFCQRYISCLKGKMPIELMVEDGDLSASQEKQRSSTTSDSSLHGPITPTEVKTPSSHSMYNNYPAFCNTDESAATYHHYPGETNTIPGLSCGALDNISDPGDGIDDCLGSSPVMGDRDGDCKGKSPGSQKKKGTFPKEATSLLRAWLFQHLSHPYPNEEQKKQLSLDTGLTNLQVNNWFINARRRIVQPMYYQNNQPGSASSIPYSPDCSARSPAGHPGAPPGFMPNMTYPTGSYSGLPMSATSPMILSGHHGYTPTAMGGHGNVFFGGSGPLPSADGLMVDAARHGSRGTPS